MTNITQKPNPAVLMASDQASVKDKIDYVERVFGPCTCGLAGGVICPGCAYLEART